jgi:cystathionine beta-lyase/cystathionine gamma-synthase
MAAISSAVLALVGAGDHVVAQSSHYMGTAQLLADFLPRFGVTVTLVDQTSAAAFGAALRAETRLILLESPSNPLLTLTDLQAVAALARARGILTLCDGTIATPINQQPLRCGIDLVIHSATKYLGGHHDLMGGVAAGAASLIGKIAESLVVLGPVPDPFAAWLLLRGLRTLPVRVERQNRTALAVAGFLAAHSAVAAVHYPGLPSHPQHALACRQMRGGYGGLLSFELRDAAAAQRFLDAMTLPSRAVSFGGFESLATAPAGMWMGAVGETITAVAGIPASLIRLSVGLEHEADLIADLARALSAIGDST